jgi:DNA-binding CsgD family transcriptional regulator
MRGRSPEEFDQHAFGMIAAQPVPPGVKRTACWLYQHEMSRIRQRTPYSDEQVLTNVLFWIDEQRLLIQESNKIPAPENRRQLQMLVDGMTQKEIALALGEHPRATRARFNRLKNRLGFGTLYELVATAVKRGWVRPKDNRPRQRD